MGTLLKKGRSMCTSNSLSARQPNPPHKTGDVTAMNERRYDCLVVGCGVVGCAVARELSLRDGAAVGVVEKEADPVAEASSGNTGHVGSFFYYTEARAPLEYRMTRRSRQLNREWLRRQPNVAAEKRKLLMPIFSDSEMDAAEELLRSARQNGEGGVSIVSAGEVLRLEPNMDVGGRRLLGGLLSADEYLVDTWLLAISYLYSALENGARLHLGREVVECAFDADSGLWTIRVRGGGKTESYTARVIVNCAGNYSDAVHEMISPGAEDPFRITPGKGEYLVFDSRPGENAVVKSLVVPVPSAVTAGVYVFSSLYGNVVVGPTSAAQRSKSDRSCDSAVQDELRARAENLFPSLRGRTVLKVSGFSSCIIS